jgi:hypothetical protein
MALGTQLQTIVEMVRDEARLSSATSRGIDHLAHIKRLVRRTHTMLCDSYEWEHLRLKRADAPIALAANQQFYTWPATLNTDRPFVAYLNRNHVWTRLDPGIAPERYNEVDSYNGARGFPLRWDWYGAAGFEVWPVPASADGSIYFEGTKASGALTADTDTADMDDILLSLQVASEILAANKQDDAAKIKMAAANTRLSQVRASKSNTDRVVIGGGGQETRGFPRHPTSVRAR